MGKQFVVAVGREYGSGGHEIAEALAGRLGIGFYDRTILDKIAEDNNGEVEELRKYDEAPKNAFLSRRILGYSNSPEEVVANLQFEYIREKVSSGESFVVVGRCAEVVLKDFKNLVSIFVLGDVDDKIARIARLRDMTILEAKDTMTRHDKKRKAYHNYYSNIKWGDARGYDLCINSSKQSFEETVDILEDYVRMRTRYMDETD